MSTIVLLYMSIIFLYLSIILLYLSIFLQDLINSFCQYFFIVISSEADCNKIDHLSLNKQLLLNNIRSLKVNKIVNFRIKWIPTSILLWMLSMQKIHNTFFTITVKMIHIPANFRILTISSQSSPPHKHTHSPQKFLLQNHKI